MAKSSRASCSALFSAKIASALMIMQTNIGMEIDMKMETDVDMELDV